MASSSSREDQKQPGRVAQRRTHWTFRPYSNERAGVAVLEVDANCGRREGSLEKSHDLPSLEGLLVGSSFARAAASPLLHFIAV